MMRHRASWARILSVAAAAAWVAAVGVPTVSASAAPSAVVKSPVVSTDKGAVQGVSETGVDAYLGMRYAAPPVGSLRWTPPKPAKSWGGIAQAAAFGNRCPQAVDGNGNYDPNATYSEDCLFLNVWRPTGTSRNAGLPVYVFIHGGGLETGASDQHDGTGIVQQDGIIVVSINYRLGVFGWMALPALTTSQGSSGDYGLMDQIAALTWVQRNIAAFGGDPSRVTIGGESAGALSVLALLSAPGAAGLFSAAVIESGYTFSGSQTDAEGNGTYFAGMVGCTVPAKALACLRKADTTTLVNTWASNIGTFPVTGTPTLPLDLGVAIMQGKIAHVPVLIGSNRDEGRTFFDGAVGWTQADYEGWLQGNFPTNQVAAVEALYPWPTNADQFTGAYLAAAIVTDNPNFGPGGCGTRDIANNLAKATTTYVYEFDNRTGPGVRPDPVGYVWGAGHAAELAYMWPSFYNVTPINPARMNAGDLALSAQMIAYWGAFVKNGQPSAAGAPNWPSLNKTQSLLSLRAANTSTVISNATFSREHLCSYWG